MYECFSCMYVCMQAWMHCLCTRCLQKSDCLETGVKDGCELHCECLELKLGALQEQEMLLTVSHLSTFSQSFVPTNSWAPIYTFYIFVAFAFNFQCLNNSGVALQLSDLHVQGPCLILSTKKGVVLMEVVPKLLSFTFYWHVLNLQFVVLVTMPAPIQVLCVGQCRLVRFTLQNAD